MIMLMTFDGQKTYLYVKQYVLSVVAQVCGKIYFMFTNPK